MSAVLMRRAAAAERGEWGDYACRRVYPRSSAIHLALADWLDEEAGRIEDAVRNGGDRRPLEPALRAAELILGESS